MPSTPLNNLFRNYKYCEIPLCDEEYTTQYERLILPIPISEINHKLNCGCLPFEYRSHLSNCKYWNETEDQPYYPGCLSDY